MVGRDSLVVRERPRAIVLTSGDEVVESGRRLSQRLGVAVSGFAPPFGRMSGPVREEVRRHYQWCVGTTQGVATTESDRFDLPRVEMWYFRSPRRWRRFATAGASPYFAWRRVLRALKQRAWR